jgi:hypothetical protein
MTRFTREDYERAADALSRGSIQFPVAVAVAALKLATTIASRCPHPVNNKPIETTVGECIAAGECGCSNRAALSGTEG